MIVKGTKTVVDYVDVNVDPIEILRKLQMKATPIGLSHIGTDGHWYRIDGYDSHKREDFYEKDRPATEEEIKLDLALDTLISYCKDKKL